MPNVDDKPAPRGAAAAGASVPLRRRMLPYLLIVPDAQTRLMDFEYQAAMYEVFHRSTINRICHYICIPIITWALLALIASIPAPADIPVFSLLAAVALLAWYVAAARRLLALALVCIAAMWSSVYLVVNIHDLLDPRTLVLVLVASSYCLTITHALEQVPPPWSGRPQWASVGEVFRGASPWRLALMVVLSMTFYVLVELISAPRLFAVQLEHLHRILAGAPRYPAARRERARRVLAGDEPLYQP